MISSSSRSSGGSGSIGSAGGSCLSGRDITHGQGSGSASFSASRRNRVSCEEGLGIDAMGNLMDAYALASQREWSKEYMEGIACYESILHLVGEKQRIRIYGRICGLLYLQIDDCRNDKDYVGQIKCREKLLLLPLDPEQKSAQLNELAFIYRGIYGCNSDKEIECYERILGLPGVDLSDYNAALEKIINYFKGRGDVEQAIKYFGFRKKGKMSIFWTISYCERILKCIQGTQADRFRLKQFNALCELAKLSGKRGEKIKYCEKALAIEGLPLAKQAYGLYRLAVVSGEEEALVKAVESNELLLRGELSFRREIVVLKRLVFLYKRLGACNKEIDTLLKMAEIYFQLGYFGKAGMYLHDMLDVGSVSLGGQQLVSSFCLKILGKLCAYYETVQYFNPDYVNIEGDVSGECSVESL